MHRIPKELLLSGSICIAQHPQQRAPTSIQCVTHGVHQGKKSARGISSPTLECTFVHPLVACELGKLQIQIRAQHPCSRCFLVMIAARFFLIIVNLGSTVVCVCPLFKSLYTNIVEVASPKEMKQFVAYPTANHVRGDHTVHGIPKGSTSSTDHTVKTFRDTGKCLL